MRLEDYSPDAICLAMGLPGFREDAALRRSGPVLRFVLRPSFHPEVCVTLTAGPEGDAADVRAFAEVFAHQPSPTDRPPVFMERTAMELGAVADLTRDFLDTARLLDEPGRTRWAVLDGMPVAVLGGHGGADAELDLNVGASEEFREFVARVIQRLHPALATGHCRNGLAVAGQYVHLHIDLDALSAVDTSTRLLVLGDEPGREEVANLLIRKPRPAEGKPGEDGGR
jgi:hypothetical protein